METGAAISDQNAEASAAALDGAGDNAGPRGPSPKTVLAIASLGAVVAFIDATIVNIAFPDIERSFPGTSISTLSWVLNAYNIFFAAFLVASARIADLLGRRRIFVAGLELFTVASLLCALAPSPGALIAFRVIQALGAALVVPSSLALVLHAFPPEQRSHGVALLSAVSAVAAGLGPSIGGVLVSADDWRLVFLVNLPIGAAAIILARTRLVESRAPGRRRMPDLLGSLMFALTIGTLVLAVVKGPDWGWTAPQTLVSFALALAFASLVVWRCTWHRSPILDLSLLRVRSFSAANGMTIVGAAGFYGYTLTNVLFLTGVWHYSTLEAGLALTPGPFVAAAVAGPTSRLVRRIGHRPVLVAGGLIWGGAVLWFVEVVGPVPDFLGQWLPGMLLLGIGAGTLLPNLTSAAIASVPGRGFATAAGLNSVARQVGAALGVAVVVAIIGSPTALDAAATFDHAWTFGSACLFVAGLGCLLVGRIDVDKSPSLGEAAHIVAHLGAEPVAAHRAYARRALTVSQAPEIDSHRPESIADFLAQVPLFAELEPTLRETVCAGAHTIHLEADRWLFHEGDPGDALYIVRAGRLVVTDERSGATLRELGRGDAVGELGLLTNSPRSASVRAVRASELVVVGKDEFERLMSASPALPVALSRTLAEQLRDSRAPASTMRPLPTTVAVVALDDRVELGTFVDRLARALGQSCAVLNGSEFGPSSGDAGSASLYAPILDRAEATHDLVVLMASDARDLTPWTQFCLQQADRILALTCGTPEVRPVRDRAELRGCDLVACDVGLGSGVLAQHVQALEPIESHAFRSATADSDVKRIARRLTGRSVGVVLSGGGARAFAHIGVLDELTSAGIEIDRVAGVSMGAFIGALFARGLDPQEIDALCFEEWVQRHPLGDYTVPRNALIRGDRVRAMLRRAFDSIAIEELPLGFVCGCAELRSGLLVLSRYGSLYDAVSFSIAVPVLAAPQIRGRSLFVDGSLVDNLPVRAMAEMGEGPIIAVDVKATFSAADAAAGAGTDADRSGQADEPRGGERKPERDGRVPGLGETLTRVILLASNNTSEAARAHADLVIKPRAAGVGLLEFHQLDAAREAGRAAAREALARAPATLFG